MSFYITVNTYSHYKDEPVTAVREIIAVYCENYTVWLQLAELKIAVF
jgi:hypothetical protein